MTDRLKVRYKCISEPTKVLWDKSGRYYIKDMNVSTGIDDDVAADYLEGMQKTTGAESTVKCRIGILQSCGIKQGGRSFT